MMSYFNTCDVTVDNSKHKFSTVFWLVPRTWNRFCHPWCLESW